MKIKSLGILTAATIALGATSANANMLFDIYAGGTFGIGGYSLYDGNDFQSTASQSYGAVLGMDFPLVRIELEYNYLNKDKINLNYGFVNAYFKLPTPIVKPYIGGGLGVNSFSKYKPNDATEIDIDDAVAYQGMLGLTFDIPVIPFNIDVEGRILYTPDMIEFANEKYDFLQYEGRVKLRYVF